MTTRLYLQRLPRTWRRDTGMAYSVVLADGYQVGTFASRREARRFMRLASAVTS